ncbi:hypothetical protein BDA96_03G215400 [Sorghum bicolor]|uniref:Uncharacterized protein n=2 Tax=Sorghum bicolor TaxID=4558 RepID=A0A921RF82_SORBI|nr:hypothetical protein BDA96_03G215400 [Sorghum bicolor]OQU87060.1 hypothetical protein SORBI_3003G199001 [Sorghum bicolor]
MYLGNHSRLEENEDSGYMTTLSSLPRRCQLSFRCLPHWCRPGKAFREVL